MRKQISGDYYEDGGSDAPLVSGGDLPRNLRPVRVARRVTRADTSVELCLVGERTNAVQSVCQGEYTPEYWNKYRHHRPTIFQVASLACVSASRDCYRWYTTI